MNVLKANNTAPDLASKSQRWLNLFVTTFFVLVVFSCFTNWIPFMQMGLLEPLKSKTRYVNTLRIPLIIFSVVLAYLWLRHRERLQNLSLVSWVKSIEQKPAIMTLCSIYGLYITQLLIVTLNRHSALETRAFDLGIFAQAVWNTLQGDFLYSSIKDGINLMGDHVSPILLVATPFYALWNDPRMLLILQVVISATCIFPIYFIAKERLNHKGLALTFSLLYLFYLPSRNALHEDFHPEVLVEPVIFMAFYFLERMKMKSFIISLMIIATAKENMLGVTCIFGIYTFIFKRLYWLGGLISVLSVAVFFIEVKWLIPFLSGKTYLYEGFYTHLTDPESSSSILQIVNGERWEYILKVFSPFLFMSFFHFPTLLLTAPILAQNILSNNPVMRSFAYHYMSGLAPFVFISAIYGLHVVTTKYTWLVNRKAMLGVALVIVGLLRSGPSEYYYWWQTEMHKSDHRSHIIEKLREVPQESRVLTHNNFIPQLINRKHVFQFEYNHTPTKAESAQAVNADYVIFDQKFWEPQARGHEEELNELAKLGYTIDYQADSFYILKK